MPLRYPPSYTGKECARSSSWCCLAWCRAHPAVDYRNVEVAEALYPERFRGAGNARNVIVATVYSSTLRRSVGNCDKPDFVILGRGRFRLATDEERARARAPKGGARQT